MSPFRRPMADVPTEGTAQSLTGAGTRIVLTLYSREYCHLCHEMRALVEQMRERFEFVLQIVDVDSDPDPATEERYGELVPVLVHGNLELARYRLSAPALEAYLIAQKSGVA